MTERTRSAARNRSVAAATESAFPAGAAATPDTGDATFGGVCAVAAVAGVALALVE